MRRVAQIATARRGRPVEQADVYSQGSVAARAIAHLTLTVSISPVSLALNVVQTVTVDQGQAASRERVCSQESVRETLTATPVSDA